MSHFNIFCVVEVLDLMGDPEGLQVHDLLTLGSVLEEVGESHLG